VNIKLELSKFSTPVLNTVLTNRGLPFHIVKGDAVSAVADLINNGLITFDEVRKTVPSQASTLATNSKIDDEVKHKIMQTQADIASAVEGVARVQDTAKALLDEQRQQRIANEAKFNDMTSRLNNALTSIQGVDYGKVETVIRTQVSDLFDSFRKVTPREEVVAIANAVPKTTRKTAFELFGDVCKYEHDGELIDFGGLEVEVWADPDTPTQVDDYMFNPMNLHQTLIALDDKLPDNVWLAGERGTGKSEFVSQVASRLGRRLFRVNFDEAIERAEFIGGNTIKGGDVEWKEGVITQAIQHAGAIILLDEIGFARSQNLAVLHALCERSPHRSIVIAETGIRIPVASHVVFFCADNSNGHGDESGNFDGVRGKNTAFLDRFSYTLGFEYLPHDKEVELINKRTMLPIDATDVIVRFANTAREKARAGLLTQPPSLRQLFAWARAIQKGVPVSIAFNNAIVNKFPAECESELRGIYSATIDVDTLKSFLVKQ
jgi:cobaltochelatase CobS